MMVTGVAEEMTSPTSIAGGTEVTVDFEVMEATAFVTTSGVFDSANSNLTISGIAVPAGQTPFLHVIDNQNSSTFIENFMLEPGRYRMAAHTGTSASASGEALRVADSSEMNFVFSVSAEGPASIPLPAAVVPGEVVLAGAQVVVMMRRRYAR